jgi:hypothetical protein
MYLSDLGGAVEFLEHSDQMRSILKACLNTLIDFVTGPCEKNKRVIGKQVQLYSTLN